MRCWRGRTGTAAMRVGCSTLVSPLLPFLIFDDFNQTKNKQTHKSYWNQTSASVHWGRMRVRSLWYLVGQSLRWRVPDPAAMRQAHQLCTQLQHMSQRQVADVGVALTCETRDIGLSTVHTRKLLRNHFKATNYMYRWPASGGKIEYSLVWPAGNIKNG